MDATRDYHTKQKVSQKEKDKYDITYMWNLKYDTDELMYKQKHTQRHGEQTCGYQGGEGVGEGWTENFRLVNANYCISSG